MVHYLAFVVESPRGLITDVISGDSILSVDGGWEVLHIVVFERMDVNILAVEVELRLFFIAFLTSFSRTEREVIIFCVSGPADQLAPGYMCCQMGSTLVF